MKQKDVDLCKSYGGECFTKKFSECTHSRLNISVYENHPQSPILFRCCDCGGAKNENKEWIDE